MKFRTELNVNPCDRSITHQNQLIFLGSCFAQHISQKCQIFGFHTLINPLGIAFHPAAILRQLKLLLGTEPLDRQRIVDKNGVFSHYDFHGSIYADTEEKLIIKFEKIREEFQSKIDKSVIFISLGTSIGYWLKNDESIVANCHKKRSDLFNKKMSKTEEVKAALIDIESILGTNQRIIFTISPVRHIKDGIENNQLSKSILHIASRNEEREYFPAYEIMLDDLRDYRFYNSDMVHPTEVAIDYIWEKFSTKYMDNKTQNIGLQCEKYYQRKQHKPLFPQSEQNRKFAEATEKLKEQILQKNPTIYLD